MSLSDVEFDEEFEDCDTESSEDEDDDDLIVEKNDRSTKLGSSPRDVKSSRLDPKAAIGSKQHQYLPRFRGSVKKNLKTSATQDSHRVLFGSLRGLVDAQSQDLRKQKEEEWLSRGGRLKSNVEELQVGEETELDRSLKQFLEAKPDSAPAEIEDNDDEDEEAGEEVGAKGAGAKMVVPSPWWRDGLWSESEGDMGVIGREARRAAACCDPRLLGRPGGVGLRWREGNDERAPSSMACSPVLLVLLLIVR